MNKGKNYLRVLERWIKLCVPYARYALPVASVFFVVGCLDGFVRFENHVSRTLGEWVVFILCTMSTALLFSSMLFVLGRLACYGLSLVLLYLLGVEALELFLTNNFGSEKAPDCGECFLVLMTSSWVEVKEFVQIYFGIGSMVVVVTIFALVGLLFAFIRKHDRAFLHDWRFRMAGLICVSPFLVFCSFDQDGLRNAATNHAFLSRGQYGNFGFFKDVSHASYHPILPQKLVSRFSSNSRLVGVIVIGESSTRNNWSLYGYQRKTTPCMDGIRSELCVFEDVVAAAHLTPKALRYIFTDAELCLHDQSHYTFSNILKHVGFRSVFLSGQNHWGCLDGVDVILFHGADKKIFLSDKLGSTFYGTSSRQNSTYYDDALLPLFDDEISCLDDRPLIVFLHLVGSHFDPANRYPSHKIVFPDDNTGRPLDFVDHYDNSIHFTDSILGRLYDRLKILDRPSFIFYLSDHGESPRGTIRRDVDDNDVWEIPMFVWWSPQYRKLFPEIVKKSMDARKMPLQEDKIFQLLLDLVQIETWPDATHSPFPPNLKERRIKGGQCIYKPEKKP